jgi:hypothetical protein
MDARQAEFLKEALAVATDFGGLLAGVEGHDVDPARLAVERLIHFHPQILVSGLCSVGKSSFVSALWGDSDLLPTAVRDCTQTNTLIRNPAPGEADRSIRLAYLTREKALQFAIRGLAFHRLAGLIDDTLGPTGPRLEDLPPEERLRETVRITRTLFQEHPKLYILHEQLTDDLEELEQFLAFIQSPDYRPGEKAEAKWEERREHLMGRRRPDGRTLETGRLLSLEYVEILRATPHWDSGRAPLLPQLLDTPWIPAYHEARRTELISTQARRVDVLIAIALPQPFTFEDWVIRLFRERPEILKRTIVLFNQADTIDASALFTREGFASVFQSNLESLTKLGIDPANVFLSCARLPFLEHAATLATDPAIAERIVKLQKTLERLRKQSEGRPASEFTRKLAIACDPADAGVESLRRRLDELSGGPVLDARISDLRAALEALPELNIPSGLRERLRSLRRNALPPPPF